MIRRLCRPAWLPCLLLVLWPGLGAWAQPSYRCMAPNGQEFWQDRPCPPVNKLQQYGGEMLPQPPRPAGSPASRMPEEPPHRRFLSSPACRDLSEALRTAESRGVGPDVVHGLEKEWRQRCSEEDVLAQQRYEEHLRAERKKSEDLRREARAASARQQADQDLCAELQRLLARRRLRSNPQDPGDQADLQRFEASRQERCGPPR